MMFLKPENIRNDSLECVTALIFEACYEIFEKQACNFVLKIFFNVLKLNIYSKWRICHFKSLNMKIATVLNLLIKVFVKIYQKFVSKQDFVNLI